PAWLSCPTTPPSEPAPTSPWVPGPPASRLLLSRRLAAPPSSTRATSIPGPTTTARKRRDPHPHRHLRSRRLRHHPRRPDPRGDRRRGDLRDHPDRRGRRPALERASP